MITSNYNLFNFKIENRGISRMKIKLLKENFKTFGYCAQYPILVDENFNIIDGQHRFVACKELGLDIIYEFSEHKSNEYMRSLNIASSNWELSDYINSYCNEGRETFVNFVNFKNRNKLTVTNALIIFFENAKPKEIREGKDMKLYKKMDELISLIDDFKDLKFTMSKTFVYALKTLVNKNIGETNIQYLIKKRMLIEQMASVEQYLIVFQNIINNKRGGHNKISLI